jgi:hypothetical protein
MAEFPKHIEIFLKGKSPASVELFKQFYEYYVSIGADEVDITKTTIAFGVEKRYCYIYQFGKDFISGVLKLEDEIDDPEVFFKTGRVSSSTFAHHFRIYENSDLNASLKKYLKKALR